MTKKGVTFEDKEFDYVIEGTTWELSIPKSQTKITNLNQLNLITIASDDAVPLEVNETDDTYQFLFTVTKDKKHWSDMVALPRNEKLRAAYNLTGLVKYLATRITFFIHPDNIVFDDNLMPQMIYRGIREHVYPFDPSEGELLKQYKCFILALFNEKYNFEELYNGSMEKANATEFQREVIKAPNFTTLISLLKGNYHKEQVKAERTMQQVPKRRYTLYKQLSIWFIVLSIVLLTPLLYMFLIKAPHQDNLLKAHREFLATDYNKVIDVLKREKVDDLPHPVKYILAYSYIKVEKLSDEQQESIMKNITLKSDASYLKYWIKNGVGDFDEAIDLAKYMDDPQLVMYGLIKKMEQIKNDPDISGAEREEQVKGIQDELDKYNEQFELDIEEELELDGDAVYEENDAEAVDHTATEKDEIVEGKKTGETEEESEVNEEGEDMKAEENSKENDDKNPKEKPKEKSKDKSKKEK